VTNFQSLTIVTWGCMHLLEMFNGFWWLAGAAWILAYLICLWSDSTMWWEGQLPTLMSWWWAFSRQKLWEAITCISAVDKRLKFQTLTLRMSRRCNEQLDFLICDFNPVDILQTELPIPHGNPRWPRPSRQLTTVPCHDVFQNPVGFWTWLRSLFMPMISKIKMQIYGFEWLWGIWPYKNALWVGNKMIMNACKPKKQGKKTRRLQRVSEKKLWRCLGFWSNASLLRVCLKAY